MTIRTFHQLLGEVAAAYEHKQALRFLQLSDVQTEFILLRLMASLIGGGTHSSLSSNLWLVCRDTKQLGAWENFFTHAFAALGFKEDSATILRLPHFSSWGLERYAAGDGTHLERIRCLANIVRNRNPKIILTTMMALGQKTLSPSLMSESAISMKTGEDFEQDLLIEKLLDLSYDQVESVTEQGTFSVRGGILDVFSPSSLYPFRLVQAGDKLDSIRYFSPLDQRSMQPTNEAFLSPVREVILRRKDRAEHVQRLYTYLLDLEVDQRDREGMAEGLAQGVSFGGFYGLMPLLREKDQITAAYMERDDVVVFLSAKGQLQQHYQDYLDRIFRTYQDDLGAKKAVLHPDVHFANIAELNQGLQATIEWHLQSDPHEAQEVTCVQWEGVRDPLEDPLLSIADELSFEKWVAIFRKIIASLGGYVVILLDTEEYLERVRDLLIPRHILPRIVKGVVSDMFTLDLVCGHVYLGLGLISHPLWAPDMRMLVLPGHKLLGSKIRKRVSSARKLKDAVKSYADLRKGAYVVHQDHGIGRFDGLIELKFDEIRGDFILLQYAENDRLYLPVDRLGLLQSYTNPHGSEVPVALDRLKGKSWEKRQAKAKEAAKEIADKLLKAQAMRTIVSRRPYSPVSEMYTQFEADFPYEETDDQYRAIAETQTDLGKAAPMDRLLCGDVGLGKTEVALRAAMRVVLDGYQVMVLVPTTVLSYQHYRTFEHRFRRYGASVNRINRFVSAKEVKEVLHRFKTGKIDILIGTHRLLSEDIIPCRLGLLVVDEEHRFGVQHKEKIKQIAVGVDILTLTATPIPRTLHMSMLGLKDISLIATAPEERLPIKTYVTEFDIQLIRSAVLRELHRGGQVFFLHNRVDDIEKICSYLSLHLPGVAMRFAHGQMPAGTLERVFVDFMERKFAVLVCTSIIESGVDLPNVNTLIVHRADQFGLAQLYQIRGRVGRAARQSYAYFLTPPERQLSNEAAKRLSILLSHQEIGSGFQIARFDLEMRGAGNFLGVEQSGHIADVGMEYYTELLEKAIEAARGTASQATINTELKIPVSASIPVDYVTSEVDRLRIYRRLFGLTSIEDIDQIKRDMLDWYGTIPLLAGRLFKIAELKYYLMGCRAATMTYLSPQEIEVTFASLNEAQLDALSEFVGENSDNYQLTGDFKWIIHVGGEIPSTEGDGEPQDFLLGQLVALVYPLFVCFEGIKSEKN